MRVQAQRLGDHLVVVAAEHEVEGEQHVERLAVQRVEVEVVRGHLQDVLVLGVGGLQVRRVDVAGAEPARLQRHPAVAALLAVLLQDVLAVLAAVEVGHLRVGLAQAVEEVQDRLPARGQVHLGVQVDVDPEVVAQGAVGFIPGSFAGAAGTDGGRSGGITPHCSVRTGGECKPRQ